MHLMKKIEEDGTGSHAERDHIGQRIEFLTDGRGYTQRAGRHAIEEIEDGTHHNHQRSPLVVAMESSSRGGTTTHQVAARNGVGDMFFQRETHEG